VASVSVETMILFIASMLIAAAVAGTFADSVGELSNALGEQGVQVSQEVRTDVEIISDSGSDAIYDQSSGNVTLLVKNTGTQDLAADPAQVDVLVDGSYNANITVTVVSDDPTWSRGAVAEVEMSVGSLSTGDHRVKLVVNGAEEVFRFRVQS
jgi:flagellar protein FlaG